jgi:hypothetical protein
MSFDCMSYKDAGAKQANDYRDRFNHLMDYSHCWERASTSRPLFHGRFVGPGKWLRWRPAATRVALRARLLTASFKTMFLGLAGATGGINLAAHRCSNFL